MSTWYAARTATPASRCRAAPLRPGGALIYGAGPWNARVDVTYAARQTRVPANDTPTEAYTLLGLALSYKFKLGGTRPWSTCAAIT